MKPVHCCWLLLAASTLSAQTAFNSLPSSTSPTIVGYQIAEQGANQRTWQKIVKVTDALGNFTFQTNRAYVECANGLSYLDPVTGQWLASREEVDAYPGGAIAQCGQYKVIFANNLNTAGAIDLQMPDGRELKSHVMGLSYYDLTSGQTVLIAQLKDCQGQIVGSNQVMYANAFEGANASVQYIYRRGSFEQNVILAAMPQPPEAYGLSSASSVLQVLTEFDAAPAPAVTSITNSVAAMADELLNFGTVRMIPGRAFMAEQDSPTGVRVAKQWTQVDGRTLLIESVPISAISNQLNQLAMAGQRASARFSVGRASSRAGDIAQSGSSVASPHRNRNSILNKVSARRLLPPSPLAKATKGKMKLARLTPKPGLVMDYVTVVTGNDYQDAVFQSDTTYYLADYLYVIGTLYLEGGAVIKSAPNANGIIAAGNVQCQTSLYRPVIFTSKNDNSAGETINGSTGIPTCCSLALSFDVGSTLQTPIEFLHIRYAANGLIYNTTATPLRHCQFVNVTNAIAGCLTVENALFDGIYGTVFNDGNTYTAVHLTVHNAHALATPNTTLNVVNSIFANVTSLGASPTGDHNLFYSCPTFGNNYTTILASPFHLPVEAGNYYVTGSYTGPKANASATLQTDFKEMTTFPPDTTKSGTTITAPGTTWNPNPNVPRETGATYTLGYHYPALDYLISQVNVQSTTLTLGQGVAVGVYGGQGLVSLDDTGSTLISQGTPLVHNQLCWYPAVQEQPVSLGSGFLIAWHGYDPPASLDAQFTDFNGLSGMLGLVDGVDCQIQLRNCRLGPGYLFPASPPEVDGLTNNLFERVNLYIDTFDWEGPVYLYNNTFINSTLTINDYWAVPNYRTIKDNLFDHSTLIVPYPGDVDYGYNAYYGGSTTLTPLGPGDFYAIVGYANGPLGNRYIDPASHPTLSNAGDQDSGAAGLCHYTIQANQNMDDGLVDIGFHYYSLLSLYPEHQTVLAADGQTTTLNLTSGGLGQCGCVDVSSQDTFTIVQAPAFGTVTPLSGSGAVQYTPNGGFEGEDDFIYKVSNGSGIAVGTAEATVQVFVAVPPALTATCLANRILLDWNFDSVLQGLYNGGPVTEVYRLNGGVWTLLYTAPWYENKYLDTAVSPGVNYSYRIRVRWVDYCGHTWELPYSSVVTASPCSLPSPIRPGFDQNVLAPNDDNSTGDGGTGDPITNILATLPFSINFFGTMYSTVNVNSNGNVTFGEALETYTPVSLDSLGVDIIAPFWADVDTRGAGSGMVTYGTGSVDGHNAFAANWIDVGYYYEASDNLNIFQLVLINRSDRASGDYDVEFDYAQIKWEAGDASGGCDGLWNNGYDCDGNYYYPAYPARAGFACSSGSTSFEISGSAVPHAFLDANPDTGLPNPTGLIYQSNLNSPVPGRYVFQFHGNTGTPYP